MEPETLVRFFMVLAEGLGLEWVTDDLSHTRCQRKVEHPYVVQGGCLHLKQLVAGHGIRLILDAQG